MKILTIVGARPQFIKAGTLSRYISNLSDVSEIIVHTGQHYDNNMSEVFFEELKIPKPNYQLNIGGLSHGAMTGRMIESLEEIVIKEKPDWLLVYGDTNSTLAGAIVASKLKVKIAHVEAGLRSYNMDMPEEINRIISDRLSKILFCPTQNAIDNLNREGFQNFDVKIINVGDIMYEGALFYYNYMEKPFFLEEKADFVLATIHREENTDNSERLESILNALNEIAKSKRVIVPLHPRTKKKIQELKLKTNLIEFVDPVSYLNIIWLLQHCKLVITDSGGLQKEAYFFNKACITLREETEWTELIKHNVNILVGSNGDKLKEAIQLKWLDIKSFDLNLYGDGKTSSKIINALQNL